MTNHGKRKGMDIVGCVHSISKFQDEITHYLYTLSLEQGHDQETGDTEMTGWYALFDGPILIGETSLHDIMAVDECFESLTARDVYYMMNAEGAILECHSSGAVYSTLYGDSELLMSAWGEIEESTAQIEDSSDAIDE